MTFFSVITLIGLMLVGEPGKVSVPGEIIKDHGQKTDVEKKTGEKQDGVTRPSSNDSKDNVNKKTSAKPAEQEKRETEPITVSPIDVNSIKIGPLDVKKELTDYALVAFTGLLIIVGVLQFWATQSAAQAASKSADAAISSTSIAEKSERAYLDVRFNQNFTLQLRPDAERSEWQIRNDPTLLNPLNTPVFTLTNNGLTRARIVWISSALSTAISWPPPLEIPPGIDNARDVNKIETKLILPPKESHQIKIEKKFFGADRFNAVGRVLMLPFGQGMGPVRMFAHGEIIYFDVFGQRHFTRFCWLYDEDTQRFVHPIQYFEWLSGVPFAFPRDQPTLSAVAGIYNDAD